MPKTHSHCCMMPRTPAQAAVEATQAAPRAETAAATVAASAASAPAGSPGSPASAGAPTTSAASAVAAPAALPLQPPSAAAEAVAASAAAGPCRGTTTGNRATIGKAGNTTRAHGPRLAMGGAPERHFQRAIAHRRALSAGWRTKHPSLIPFAVLVVLGEPLTVLGFPLVVCVPLSLW